MSMGGSMMLMGAESRLLPLSIPYRFFIGAGVYHVGFWLALLLGGEDILGFELGLGPGLAAIHILTLGVFAMTAVGAGLQLLPVASRRPIQSPLLCRTVSWMMIPGVTALALGMWQGEHDPLAVGTFLVVPALAIFAYLALNNLRFGRGFEVVSANGWAALICLLLIAVLGFALIADVEHGFLANRAQVGLIHLVLAAYGFMGLFAIGFGYVLLPMFAMGRSVSKPVGFQILALSLAAMAVVSLGLWRDAHWIISIGAGLGLAAGVYYVITMERILRAAMKKRLGISFIFIRVSWAFLILSLIAAVMLPHDFAPGWLGQLFGLLLLPGWLLAFLLGVLQRIAPFLASMHSAGDGRQPALLSTLAPERPLHIHGICHALALILVTAGMLIGNVVLLQAGAAAGTIGALCFLWFLIDIIKRLKAHVRAG